MQMNISIHLPINNRDSHSYFIIFRHKCPIKIGTLLIIKQIWLIKPKTFFVILKFSSLKEVSKMSFVGQ
jgi:hypothetical protein